MNCTQNQLKTADESKVASIAVQMSVKIAKNGKKFHTDQICVYIVSVYTTVSSNRYENEIWLIRITWQEGYSNMI